jgi:AcrR family transcriptional regulator
VADSQSGAARAEDIEPGRRIRKSSAVRRAELIAVARNVFADGGPSEGGMADVAGAAGVSKGLLYHYFPAGRGELADAVAEQLLDDLFERVAVAANLPFSPIGRLEQVLAVIVGFFAEQPVAYRLLVAPGDEPGEDGVRALARVRLNSMVTTLMAGADIPVDELFRLSTGLLDEVLATVERCLGGRLEPEEAWRQSCRQARDLFDAA